MRRFIPSNLIEYEATKQMIRFRQFSRSEVFPNLAVQPDSILLGLTERISSVYVKGI